MDLASGGDLLNYVRRRGRLKEDLAKFIFRQIILGLQYINSKGILHRDIKLENILLTTKNEVKICDFGVCNQDSSNCETQNKQCGTLAYLAPEVCIGKGYKGFASDIWGAGVVLYVILYGTLPFRATNNVELKQSIIKA